MRVTIWDLDYYYAKDRKNTFNPDVMKISSYHKQKGDLINFVEKEFDINRPYDLFYIIKNDDKIKNPPLSFFMNPRVRWWGEAYKRRINWKMDNVMLACRPDYLLYPELTTPYERAEHIRLLNDKGEILPITQDYRNSFRNKMAIATDTKIWQNSKKNTLHVLKQLGEAQKISFLEPILIEKIVFDKEIRNAFFELNLTPGSVVEFIPIDKKIFSDAGETWARMKDRWPYVGIGPLKIKQDTTKHWWESEKALEDFKEFQKLCIEAKRKKVRIEIAPLEHRLDTPYFFVFETLSNWTKHDFTISWLEWITIEHGVGRRLLSMREYWNHPKRWNGAFRDLLVQTYLIGNIEFLVAQWGERNLSENDIPWKRWEKEFELKI